MATFMQVTKRLNSNKVGYVSGSDWTSAKYPMAYLGFKETGSILFGLIPKVDRTKLMIYGVGIEDYFFDKSNIKSATIIEQQSTFVQGKNRYIGPKYKIEFNDGKSAIIFVPSGDSYKIEAVIY
ncbi:MAG: hypothetical protein IKC58_01510 [Clostridia bacterium]|nr:hypothetical protein [Clostridia bacterium]MBQ2914988.1 hypothetical protein [Clostridia bacterium]MBQ3042089.1 hypothetical protein [Clostridia bacterium]MBQ9125645.1 hypothetical protein [Clostridia bacterium]MBR1955464.1 hypothetical protein [Clostridia bacterium]